MPSPYLQAAFSGGEVSPSLYPRTDIDKYQISVALLKNFIVHAHGGASNRAGLEYVATTKDSTKKTRLIPFSFNTEQTYMLEFGDQYMRVYKDGGQVVEPGIAITGATQANPVVITTGVAHSYSNGEEVYLSGFVGGMTELNGRRFIIANTTATTYELVGEDGTGHSAYSSGGVSSRIFTLTTPYLEADLFLLKFVQSADVMTICHADYEPRNLSRTDHHVWTLAVIAHGPSIAQPTLTSATYSGTGTGITYKYVVTKVNIETGEESIASTSKSVSGDLSTSGDKVALVMPSPGAGFRYNVFKSDNDGDFFGFIGQSTGTAFTDRNIEPDYNDAPATSVRDPFAAAGDYPGVVSYYQQRRMFANSDNKPQTIWGSQSANYDNMNVSTPSKADDAVTFTIVAREVNEIRWMIPLRDLLLFTSGGEWLAQGSDDSRVITPSSFKADVQTQWGTANVKPEVIGNSVVFVQEKGAVVRDIAYSLVDDGYNGNELSILAHHLFDTYEIVEWAYAKAPHSILWAVRSDGVLLGLTYLREHQVWAWHQHDTAGKFESVAVIGEGQEDVLYCIVKRWIGGQWVRTIERMHTRIIDNVRDSFFVDCGLSLDIPLTIEGITQANPAVVTSTGHNLSNTDLIDVEKVEGMTEVNGNRYKVKNVTANTFELTNPANDANIDSSAFGVWREGGVFRKAESSFTGLDHLEGETVSVLADGSVISPSPTVTNGAISLAVPASRVHAGLSYLPQMKTLPFNVINQEGTTQHKPRSISKVTIFLKDTRGLWVGASFDYLYEIQQAQPVLGQPIELFTGQFEQTVGPTWDTEGELCFEQRDPLPVTIGGLLPEMEVGE